ncbi:hypothetical protein B0H19DRAFT_1075551 [Mycena capillaripes]|nr:hypothetical protein B0H19DRAFT_1075551 [Mycena capillaripes]
MSCPPQNQPTLLFDFQKNVLNNSNALTTPNDPLISQVFNSPISSLAQAVNSFHMFPMPMAYFFYPYPIIFTVANGVNGGNATYLSNPAATGSDGLKQFSQADIQPLLNALFFQVNCTSATTGLSLMRNLPGVRSNFGSLQASIEVMTGLEREVDDEKYLKMECSDLRWSICEAGESDVSDEEQDPAKPMLRGYFLLQKGNCTRGTCAQSAEICIIQSEKVTVRWLKYLAYGSTDEKVSGRLQDAIVDAGKASSRDKIQAQLHCVAVHTRSDDLAN